MNSNIKRNLALAGCLSVLFVSAADCYAGQTVAVKDGIFNKIKYSGVMTGAAINIENDQEQTKGDESVNDSVTNRGTLHSEGALTGITTLSNFSTIDGSGSLTITNGGVNQGIITQSAFTLTGGTFNNGNDSTNGTINVTDMTITGGTFNNGTTNATGTLSVIGTLTNSSTIANAANSEITAGTIENNNTISNAGAINAALNNANGAVVSGEGTLTLQGGENNGTITQNDITVQNNVTYTNNGSITANNKFTNSGTIDGDNGTLIIKASTDEAKASSSTGSITQGNVTVSGIFNNGAKLNANTKLSNSGTINNTSSIVAGEIVNETGSALTGSGNLEVAKGTNNGKITQSVVKITGSGQNFNNNGTLTAENTFTNSANITGNSGSTLNIKAGGETTGNITQDNIKIGGSTFAANGTTITSNVKFENSAALTGTGTLSIKDGSSTGTINMGTVSVSGSYENKNTLTAGTLNNSGTITNTSTIKAIVNNSTAASKIEGANGGIEFLAGSTNYGTIEQTIVTVTGDLTNTGTLTANGEFTNNASITGDNGALNINAGGKSSGSINQKDVSIAGAFTNSSSITASNSFSNIGTLTNNGSITAQGTFENNGGTISTTTTEDGKGSLTVKNGSNNGTINLNSVTFAAGGEFENAINQAITAATMTNNGNLTNKGSLIATTEFSNTSTISGTGSLRVQTAGSNSGTISLDTLTIDKDFTNTSTGQIQNTQTTVESGGNFTNEGTITGGTVNVEGEFTNSGTISGGTTTVSGTLTNNKTIENSAVTVDAGGQLTNNKDITGGSITANGKFENGTGGTVTNSTVTINGTGDANASTNSGTITGGTVKVEGEFTNSGTISGGTTTVSGTLTNEGTISNSETTVGGTASDGSTVSGTLNNTGTITGGSLTVNAGSSVNNSGTMGDSLNLTINKDGQVTVGGEDAVLSTTGQIAIETGGSIVITEGGSVTLKTNDTWLGDISNTNGTLTLSGRDDTNGGYNSYTQNGGNLVLNNSEFILKDGSEIENGTVTLAGGSSFDIAKGASMTGGELKYTGERNVVNVYDTIAEAAQLDIKDGITYNVFNNEGNVTLNNDDVWSGSGTVHLQGGTVNFKGTAASDGTTTGTSNGILKADSGTLLVNSALNISTGSYIENAVTVAINKDVNISDTGSVELNAGDSWASVATINQTGGKLTIDGYDKTTQGQGTLKVNAGEVSINNSTIDITGESLIAAAAKTTISGGSTVNINGGTNGGGSVTLDKATGDSWSADSTINLGADGTLNYNLESNGKLVAEGGNLNINGGKLTLADASDKIDSAVVTAIKAGAALDVQNGDVTINGGGTGADDWKGTLAVSRSGNLTIDGVTSNGALQATGGTLDITGSELTLGSDSQIAADAKTTLTSSTITIDGAGVNLNDSNDSWSEDTTINLTSGTLDYSLDSNGKLVASDGNLNVNGGVLTLAQGSSVAEAVKTTVTSDIIVKGTGENKSTLNLNSGDSWTSGVITVDEEGIFNYKDITSTGTLVSKDGTFNLESGNLTLKNTNSTADAGIAAAVDAAITGNLTIKDNVSVNLDDAEKDSWSGHISLEGGSLDYSLNSNGQLTAETGSLNVNAGKLTLASESYVKDAVTTLIDSSVDIKGGELNLNQDDSWSRDSVVNLNGGTLNYADLTDNGVFQGVKGNLNTKEGSTFNVTGNDSADAYIKSDIVANIKGDLVIGNKGTVDLGTVNEGDAADTVLGNITVNDGGTLNVFNDLNFKPVKEGEYSDQLITIDEQGKMNLNTTGELHLYPNLTGTGSVDKNGEGDVWFHGTITDNLKIYIKNGGDLLFEHGLGGNLIVGEEVDGKGLTIGIHADEIKGDLIQERDITMKYSTYHDDVDLNLASEPGSVVNVTKGAIIAESKGDKNINFGGAITVNPAENWEKPVSMTATSNGSINFNDTVSVTDATLNVTAGRNNNFATDVTLTDSTMNISSGDSANFAGTTILEGSAMNVVGDLNFNILKFNGTDSTIRDMNGVINNNTISDLNLYDGMADFTVDINGRDWKHDKFVISDLTTLDGGQINVSDWQFADDWRRTGKAPIDRHIVMNMFDVSNVDPAIAATINFTQTDKQIFTPIGWYKLENYTKWNSQIGAYESVPGVLQASLARYNPQVFRGQVATMAQYNNQLMIDDMLTNHVPLQSERLLAQGESANRYAAINPLFAPYQYRKEDGGIWVKNYVTFEHLSMTHNLKVGNNAYGTLIGADFPVVNMKKGWKFLPTAYIGYNGGHQHFDGVSMYQNGGQGGFMGTFMKNDFIGSVVAYAGGYFNEMKVAGYNDETGNWFAGTAAKASYNLHATRHFALQPNLFVSYNAFGKQNWSTDYGDMSMASGMINGINVAPGLNLIYARETWSLYGTFQYMYNINEGVSGNAGHVDLPDVKMKHGYIQYGMGVTKTWKDRLSSYFQLTFRNGGRTGIGFQLGAQYLFDWFKVHKKASNEMMIEGESQKTLIRKL